jgi:hypothetical protein
MSGVVDSGRKTGHRNIDANDPGCVKTPKSREDAENDLSQIGQLRPNIRITVTKFVIGNLFYRFSARSRFYTTKTKLGHERSIFTAMNAAEACVRATNVELMHAFNRGKGTSQRCRANISPPLRQPRNLPILPLNPAST